MRGRLPSTKTLPAGKYPDWSSVRWYVYDDPITTADGVQHCYRVSPRRLSAGECRRFEVLVTTVGRCSLATVRELLKRNVSPTGLQAAVDGLAEAQIQRALGKDKIGRT